MSAAPKEFVYPYTVTAKLRQFPWKWYWKNARAFRFTAYAFVAFIPAIWKIDRAVHSPANVEEWKERRAKRNHTHFDPPHE